MNVAESSLAKIISTIMLRKCTKITFSMSNVSNVAYLTLTKAPCQFTSSLFIKKKEILFVSFVQKHFKIYKSWKIIHKNIYKPKCDYCVKASFVKMSKNSSNFRFSLSGSIISSNSMWSLWYDIWKIIHFSPSLWQMWKIIHRKRRTGVSWKIDHTKRMWLL